MSESAKSGWVSGLEIFDAYSDRKDEGGLFAVCNIGELEEPSMAITPTMRLRVADRDEANRLASLFCSRYPSLRNLRNPFESWMRVDHKSEGMETRTFGELPPDRLRYHLIEYDGGDRQVYDLVAASAVTPKELEIGPSVHWFNNGTVSIGGADAESFLHRAISDDSHFETWKTDDVKELADVGQRWSTHDEGRTPLRLATADYMALRRISNRHWRLHFMGLFTILESLITDGPNVRRDSIRHQIVRKMSLLERRFLTPLPRDLLRRVGAKDETVWEKLCDVRNHIAHGRRPDFNDPKHAIELLVSFENTEAFLRCSVKAVMRQALEEPDLVADLQAC